MQKTLAQRMEDHALEPVPKEDRKSWIQLSWSTVGIVTTLLQLYLGAFLSFTAGIKIALVAGFLIAIIGSALGWAAGLTGQHWVRGGRSGSQGFVRFDRFGCQSSSAGSVGNGLVGSSSCHKSGSAGLGRNSSSS